MENLFADGTIGIMKKQKYKEVKNPKKALVLEELARKVSGSYTSKKTLTNEEVLRILKSYP